MKKYIPTYVSLFVVVLVISSTIMTSCKSNTEYITEPPSEPPTYINVVCEDSFGNIDEYTIPIPTPGPHLSKVTLHVYYDKLGKAYCEQINNYIETYPAWNKEEK